MLRCVLCPCTYMFTSALCEPMCSNCTMQACSHEFTHALCFCTSTHAYVHMYTVFHVQHVFTCELHVQTAQSIKCAVVTGVPCGIHICSLCSYVYYAFQLIHTVHYALHTCIHTCMVFCNVGVHTICCVHMCVHMCARVLVCLSFQPGGRWPGGAQRLRSCLQTPSKVVSPAL